MPLYPWHCIGRQITHPPCNNDPTLEHCNAVRAARTSTHHARYARSLRAMQRENAAFPPVHAPLAVGGTTILFAARGWLACRLVAVLLTSHPCHSVTHCGALTRTSAFTVRAASVLPSLEVDVRTPPGVSSIHWFGSLLYAGATTVWALFTVSYPTLSSTRSCTAMRC